MRLPSLFFLLIYQFQRISVRDQIFAPKVHRLIACIFDDCLSESPIDQKFAIWIILLIGAKVNKKLGIFNLMK